MSFVSIVACESFITVVSDGLVTNYYEGPRNPSGNQKKFKKFAHDKFIAFAGHLQLVEIISTKLVEKYNGQSLKETTNQVKRLIQKAELQKGVSANIVIGGFNEQNKPEIYTLSTKDQITNEVLDFGDGVQVVYLYGPETNKDKVRQKMRELSKGSISKDPNTWIEHQKALNKYVSQFDSTVNNTTFELIIKRP